jgi:curved DNA-binding protein CbpA
MDRIHTHYDNLKVTRNAPSEVIKAAYRAMAQKYHPDGNPAMDAVRVMKIVNEAWAVLSDPKLREEHDRWIAVQEGKATTKFSSTTNGEQTFKTGDTEFTYQKAKAKYSNASKAFIKEKSRENNSETPKFDQAQGFYSDATEGYKVSGVGWATSLSNSITKAQSWVIGAIISLTIFGFTYAYILSTNAKPSSLSTLANTKDSIPKLTTNVGRESTKIDPEVPLKIQLRPAQPKPDFSSYGTIVPNGYIKGDKQIFGGGLSTFKIDNSNGSEDAEVRLYLNNRQIRSMFIQAGSEFTAEKLAPGTYKMRYKIIVDGQPKVYQAKDDFILSQTVTETDTGTRTRFSRMTVTLYKVSDGNMQTEEVPASSF